MELTENSKKPKWLEVLERQSWEAELIMSGLAIYGSFQLYPAVDRFVERMAIHFDDRILDILNYAFLYVYASITLIIMSFITHFVLRLLWVGTLGLGSVYPEGINLKNEAFSKSFLEKAKAEFPSLTDYSLTLDKTCSIIFSVLCSGVLMMFSITIWIIIFIIVTEILSLFLSDEILAFIGWTLVALFYIAAIIIALISTGKFKETAFAEKYAYPFSRNLSKLISLFWYKPGNFISYTIRTNVSTAQFMLGIGIILILSMLFTTDKISKISDIYESRSYFEMNSRVELANSNNYMNQFKDYYILSPIIQSQDVEEDYLKLFIPKLKREWIFKKEICGEFEKSDSLSRHENRLLREQYRNECATKSYQVFINDKSYPDVIFKSKVHEHAGEKGYEAYISIDDLQRGNHTLKILIPYKNEEGRQAERLIPFYKI